MRLGIYGGSFSPIHLGHLLLAEACREYHRLDEVWFLPAATSPLKQDFRMTSDAHRAAMVELAIAGHGAFRMSRLELDRGGVSYTVDTLRDIQHQMPEAELFLLVGADSIADFPRWRAIEKICSLAQVCAVGRTGYDLGDLSHLGGELSAAQIQRLRDHFVPMPLVEISSSDIRERLGSGRSIRYMVPRSVEKYIETQRVFSSQPSTGS